MFRKNYVPKLSITKSSKTGKWFAFVECDPFDRYFHDANFGCSIGKFGKPTEYESIEDLMSAIYKYASILHTEAIHKKIEQSIQKVKL